MLTILLKMSLLALLVLIGFQDFRYRGISWYLFPILASLLYFLNPGFRLSEGILNVSLVLSVFTLLSLWFSFREGKVVNVLSGYIGLGDFLFLFCLSLYFSTGNFFLFYILSLLVVLLSVGIYLTICRVEDFTVPLAGLQGVLLLLVLLSGWITGYDPGNTDFISMLL